MNLHITPCKAQTSEYLMEKVMLSMNWRKLSYISPAIYDLPHFSTKCRDRFQAASPFHVSSLEYNTYLSRGLSPNRDIQKETLMDSKELPRESWQLRVGEVALWVACLAKHRHLRTDPDLAEGGAHPKGMYLWRSRAWQCCWSVGWDLSERT